MNYTEKEAGAKYDAFKAWVSKQKDKVKGQANRAGAFTRRKGNELFGTNAKGEGRFDVGLRGAKKTAPWVAGAGIGVGGTLGYQKYKKEHPSKEASYSNFTEYLLEKEAGPKFDAVKGWLTKQKDYVKGQANRAGAFTRRKGNELFGTNAKGEGTFDVGLRGARKAAPWVAGAGIGVGGTLGYQKYKKEHQKKEAGYYEMGSYLLEKEAGPKFDAVKGWLTKQKDYVKGQANRAGAFTRRKGNQLFGTNAKGEGRFDVGLRGARKAAPWVAGAGLGVGGTLGYQKYKKENK